MIVPPSFLKRTIAASAFFGAGLGLGSMATLGLLISDHPNIVIEERWRVVEVPTPVPGVEPNTPFGIDPNVYVLDLPVTTTSTMKPATTMTVPSTTSPPVPTTTSPPTTSSPAPTVTTEQL